MRTCDAVQSSDAVQGSDAVPSTARSTAEFVALDDQFHSALAQATHNPLLVVLSNSIGAIMHAVRLQVHEFTRIAGSAIPDHMAILAAIEANDAEAAAAAMQVHLDHALYFQREYLALAGDYPGISRQ
jgi:GntR family transcriptional repressor for pyruvate dehydrogenase complex